MNNWQLYAYIFVMIFFVLGLFIVLFVWIAKQDNPNLPSPLTKGFWIE